MSKRKELPVPEKKESMPKSQEHINREKLVSYRSKIKTEIASSKIQRDNLLSNLSKKINEEKIKENRVRASLKAQSVKDKKKNEESKAKNKIEFSLQKKAIKEKQAAIQEGKKTLKLELSLLDSKIKNKKLANLKRSREQISSVKSIINEEKIHHKQELNNIKIETNKMKTDLLEKRIAKKAEAGEISRKAKSFLVNEKIRVAKEKEKLRKIKSENNAIAKAKRSKKIEDARNQKIALRKLKEEARLKHKKEILSIRNNRVSKKKNIEEELKEKDAAATQEIKLMNDQIQEDKTQIIKLQEDAKTVVEANKLELKMGNDFSDKFQSVFSPDETVEDETEEKNIEHNKMIEGSIINSFGKFGALKFKTAQMPTNENDKNKYKNNPLIIEELEKFNEELPEAIRLKSLFGYVEIILEKRFTEKETDAYHAHLITAILTGHAIRFADGFISPVRTNKRLVLEFTKILDDPTKLVELLNIDIGKEMNSLITKKLEAGGSILLANGLIATMEDDTIAFLQDTNFMKA